MAVLLVLLLAVPLQPTHGTPRADRVVAAYQPASLAEGIDIAAFRRCSDLLGRKRTCGFTFVVPRRLPNGWIVRRDTFAVGVWRARPLALHVMRRTVDRWNETHLRLVDAETDSTIARLRLDGDPWASVWPDCTDDPLMDLDGNGLRDLMVPTSRGGGPYSVNVSVQAVHVVPEAGGLVLRWPELSTPRVNAEAGVVRTQSRHRNFGRGWSVGRYQIERDTLTLAEEIGYHVLDDAMLENWDSALFERSRLGDEGWVPVDTLRGDEIPTDDIESYAC